jgi:PAS domain S-box-containing protein
MRSGYHQKIGARLGFGFAIVVGLTILLGVVALLEMNSQANLNRDLYNHTLVVSNAIRDIRGNILVMHRSMKEVALAKTDKPRQDAVRHVNEEEQAALQSFEILYASYLGDKADIDAVYQAFGNWKPVRDKVIDLVQSGGKDQTDLIAQSQGDEQVLRINEYLQVIRNFANQKTTLFFNSSQESAREHLWAMSGLVLLITAAGILGSLLITRSITGPLGYVMEQIGEVAGGNLDHKINLNSDDEIGQLARTFDDMTASLKKITTSRNELDAANQQVQVQVQVQQLHVANQQLDASEQLRESIISTVPGVVYRLQMDVNGTFSMPYLSQQAESILGHPLNILTHSDCFFDIIHPLDADGFRLSIRDSAQTLEPCVLEFRVIDANGRLKWLKSISTPRRYADNSAIWNGIIIDITDRKQDEVRLQESENRYRIVADNTYDWEFWLSPDGRYVYVSPSCQRITGFTAEEFKTNPDLLKTIIHPDDKPRYQIHNVESTTQKSSGSVEFRIIDKTGQVHWIEHFCQPIFDRDGKWLGIRGSNRDITGRKKTENALRMSDIKYKTLFEGLSERIFLKDSNLVYVSCNEHYARNFNITADEIVGKTDNNLYSSQLAEKYTIDERNIINSGKAKNADETILQNGREINLHSVKLPVKDTDGNVTGVLGILVDTTAQKQTQNMLLHCHEQIQDLASEILSAKDQERQQLAIELHDNIMQSLVLFKINMSVLLNDKLPSESKDLLNNISCDIDQIIQNTRSLTFELASPALHELGLENAVRELLRKEIRQKHEIKTEFKNDAQAEPLNDEVHTVLYRAVRELLVNLVKHANAHLVKVSIHYKENRIYIDVIDDGIGFIYPLEISALNKAGGFGLFSIRERLNYIGGSLEIDSKPGRGTRVTLAAPTKQGENLLTRRQQ